MRLDFFRHKSNKKRLRRANYQGLIDSIVAGVQQVGKVGKRVYLPSTFIGGPKDMRHRYLNLMTLVQEFGKPDIFLTMTCNPNWPEIKELLQPGEESHNRPDFLPEYKLLTPEAYDRMVCSELPDKNEDSYLYSLVVRHMMYGPCGELNPKNVCIKDERCKNHYPKNFSEYTFHGKGIYPVYLRRADKRQAKVKGHMLNNQWVIPYNPTLLAEFDCHINVEGCCHIKAVKYLYKYIHKGHDKVMFRIACNDPAQVGRPEVRIIKIRNTRVTKPMDDSV
ncbi:hypothetical protein LIER_16766 [Lithospermum erythrorhizon]|uniref:Helitron helicase-like domain-containing protein n=1 Tax=Lithospermum erythrorhizon TaxID=34254 RepID=A0AAV3QC19_LITER